MWTGRDTGLRSLPRGRPGGMPECRGLRPPPSPSPDTRLFSLEERLCGQETPERETNRDSDATEVTWQS